MKKSKKLTIAQKAKKAGIPAQTVYNRMHHGWHEKKALSVPVRKKTKPKKVAYSVKDLKEAEKKYKKAVSDFESIKPTNVKPKVVIPKKVEPNKVPSPLSRRMKKEIPVPVEKYEGKSRNWQVYVIVVLAVVLILAIMLK